MLHSCDLQPLLLPFRGKYEAHLNSEDFHQPELALEKAKAHGGTLLMWQSSISPFITVLPTKSPSFQSLLLKLPGLLPSIHTVIYLPTSGKEDEYITALVDLDDHLTNITNEFPDAAIFLRGDANANPNNVARYSLFTHFCSLFSLSKVPLLHPTYHHFVGNGLYDSEIDVLLYHGPHPTNEKLDRIVCKLDSPFVNSAHDVILSLCTLPAASTPTPDVRNITAPRINNDRVKIIWNDDDIIEYENIIGTSLRSLREQWGNTNSRSSLSILLSSTYACLSLAACSTNKSVNLGSAPTPKPIISPTIRAKERAVLSASKQLRAVLTNSPDPDPDSVQYAQERLRSSRSDLKAALRTEKSDMRKERCEKLFSILSTNPSSVHRSIKNSSKSASSAVNQLKVQDKVYTGNQVPDGFFDSLSSLKAPDLSSLHSSSQYQDTLMDYENVLKIARDGLKIPQISPKHSTEILHKLKKNVNDFFSITPAHFINAGMEGHEHFHFLLNTIINDVNLSSLEELNTIWACILHKGHGKDKESDRSYRTISTCPLLAKALDFYIGELYGDGWADAQAETQFQGAGSSHELAGLLLTEAINFSLYTTKKPVYLLLLDAKSAFDLIPRENIIVNAFKAGTTDQGLIYLNNRLANRLTFCEWDKELMGPIRDLLGVEQGGINSDRLYKLANNCQIETAQNSKLGVNIGSMVASCIGQADDTALISNDIFQLQNLLLLTLEYCERYNVTLVPEKTKLLAFCPPGSESETTYAKIVSPISINGSFIPFSDSAEHVGIIRSVDGNLPNIFARLSAHNRAVFSVLSAGLARGHSGNPAAAMRVEKLYGIPVMLSGLATMVLSKTETSLLDGHFKLHSERLLKLHKATPACVVWFLSGCLPTQALLHLRQFTLFGMICRLHDGENVLAHHARHILATAKPSAKSWFSQILDLCLQYSLPHPITFLNTPPTKLSFKNLVKSSVVDYWERKLRGEAAVFKESSLKYFSPEYMSLSITHPLFSTCAGSPYEVSKAKLQARYLSGRARVESLTRHWNPSNKEGLCPLCRDVTPSLGTMEHIFLSGGCPALIDARLCMLSFIQAYMVPRQYLLPLMKSCWGVSDSLTMQLLLDCSVIPEVIQATQEASNPVMSDLFYLTRTYIFKLHRTRQRLLEVI